MDLHWSPPCSYQGNCIHIVPPPHLGLFAIVIVVVVVGSLSFGAFTLNPVFVPTVLAVLVLRGRRSGVQGRGDDLIAVGNVFELRRIEHFQLLVHLPPPVLGVDDGERVLKAHPDLEHVGVLQIVNLLGDRGGLHVPLPVTELPKGGGGPPSDERVLRRADRRRNAAGYLAHTPSVEAFEDLGVHRRLAGGLRNSPEVRALVHVNPPAAPRASSDVFQSAGLLRPEEDGVRPCWLWLGYVVEVLQLLRGELVLVVAVAQTPVPTETPRPHLSFDIRDNGVRGPTGYFCDRLRNQLLDDSGSDFEGVLPSISRSKKLSFSPMSEYAILRISPRVYLSSLVGHTGE
mmetsp:Transcript_34328/g.47907  ORF Transcript_34328/g.47907 Transcript_34328/m.47907 type:complete len:344 (-) Transcript_34328:502-1533(-)